MMSNWNAVRRISTSTGICRPSTWSATLLRPCYCNAANQSRHSNLNFASGVAWKHFGAMVRLAAPYMGRLLTMNVPLSNTKAKKELGWETMFPSYGVKLFAFQVPRYRSVAESQNVIGRHDEGCTIEPIGKCPVFRIDG